MKDKTKFCSLSVSWLNCIPGVKSGAAKFQRRRRDIVVVCRPQKSKAPSGAAYYYFAPMELKNFIGLFL
jgi:hypothetical protein